MKLDADRTTLINHHGERLMIGDRPCPLSEAHSAMAALLETLPPHVTQSRRVPLGAFHGLQFGLLLDPTFPPDVYLEGATTRRDSLSREHHGPRAILNAVERLAGGYGRECIDLRQDVEIAQAQLRDYQARLGQPFDHDVYLSRLAALRDQLKAGLASQATESVPKAGLTVSELAEQIKALRAAHTVEAAPDRAPHQQATAAEPVTTRIRRNAAANFTVTVTEQDAAVAPLPEALRQNAHDNGGPCVMTAAGDEGDNGTTPRTTHHERHAAACRDRLAHPPVAAR